MQINHPPPEPPRVQPDGYVRPSRFHIVAPLRIAYAAYVGTLAVVLGALSLAHVKFGVAWLVAVAAACIAQYAADGWWRSNHPPSADQPRKSLFSKNPDDYR